MSLLKIIKDGNVSALTQYLQKCENADQKKKAVNEKDESDRSLLEITIKLISRNADKRYDEILNLLLAHGADVNVSHEQPLRIIIKSLLDLKNSLYLISNGWLDLNKNDAETRYLRYIEVIRQLLLYKADPNSLGSLIHEVAAMLDPNILGLLFNASTPIKREVLNKEYETNSIQVLLYKLLQNSLNEKTKIIACLRILIENGAEVNQFLLEKLLTYVLQNDIQLENNIQKMLKKTSEAPSVGRKKFGLFGKFSRSNSNNSNNSNNNFSNEDRHHVFLNIIVSLSDHFSNVEKDLEREKQRIDATLKDFIEYAKKGDLSSLQQCSSTLSKENIDRTDDCGLRAVDYASELGHHQMLLWLVEKGANPYKEYHSSASKKIIPIRKIIDEGNIDLLESLVKASSINFFMGAMQDAFNPLGQYTLSHPNKNIKVFQILIDEYEDRLRSWIPSFCSREGALKELLFRVLSDGIYNSIGRNDLEQYIFVQQCCLLYNQNFLEITDKFKGSIKEGSKIAEYIQQVKQNDSILDNTRTVARFS